MNYHVELTKFYFVRPARYFLAINLANTQYVRAVEETIALTELIRRSLSMSIAHKGMPHLYHD